MPESRQTKKDTRLQDAFAFSRENGGKFVRSERIQSAIRTRNLKFRKKKDNISGLQLCDLLAHPSHIYVRELMGHDVSPGPFAKRVIDILKHEKYDRSPETGIISGYGIKHLP